MEAMTTIVNRKKGFNHNSLSSIDNSKRVDLLYDDVKDLIDPAYKPWFMKRFQKLNSDNIRGKASEIRQQVARGDARNPQSIFTMLVKREAGF